jgi:hypothetical protein
MAAASSADVPDRGQNQAEGRLGTGKPSFMALIFASVSSASSSYWLQRVNDETNFGLHTVASAR